MNPDEIAQWIQSLPPHMQQAMFQTYMGMGTGLPPMGEFQVNPYDPISPSTAYNYVPELDKYGNVQPWDLTVAQKNLNLQQDQRYQLKDPMLGALAGPGAFGAGAFDPILTNAAEMQEVRPGANMLMNAAQLDPFSYEGFIAQAMLPVEQGGKGLSAGAAQQLFRDEASAVNDDGTPSETAARLLGSLPQKPVEDEFGNFTGDYMPDHNAPFEFGQQLQMEMLKDQQVQPVYEDSPAAKFYREQGLPLPTERYGEGQYSLEALIPGYEQSQADFTAAHDLLRQRNATARDAKAEQDAMMRMTMEEFQGAKPGAQPQQPTRRPTSPGYDMPVGRNMTYDTGTGEMLFNVGPDIPGLGPVGGQLQLQAPKEFITEKPKKEEEREDKRKTPTQANLAQEQIDASRRYADARTAKDAAKKDRRRLYREVNSPEAVFQRNRNQALNQAGRAPLSDALMARQIALYLSGGYGPMG